MKTQVNLLPLSRQIRFEHIAQARRWSILWIATSCAVIGLHGLFESHGRSLTDQVAKQENEAAPVRALHVSMQQLQAKSQANKQQLERYQAIAQADLPLSLLQVLVAACGAVRNAVQLEMIRVDENPLSKPAAGDKSALRTGKVILLVGRADGDAPLAGFLGALRSSPLFESVELETSQSVTDTNFNARTFQIRCQF